MSSAQEDPEAAQGEAEAQESENAIVLREVTKTYRPSRKVEAVEALSGVTMRVPRGTRVAIKGRSGSGKTTLLSIIGALDVPTTGSVEVDGRQLEDLREGALTKYRARTIGFVFQKFYLLPSISAQENVELAMEAVGVAKGERGKRALDLLKQVGLSKRARHLPGRLSGGEQQRVAIARALANDPPILLADEPTGNLDDETGDEVAELLFKIVKKRRASMVVVTHDEDIARRCDFSLQMKEGTVRAKRPEAQPLLQVDGKGPLDDGAGR
jgi:putative ABC transport system ATP-binding protein